MRKRSNDDGGDGRPARSFRNGEVVHGWILAGVNGAPVLGSGQPFRAADVYPSRREAARAGDAIKATNDPARIKELFGGRFRVARFTGIWRSDSDGERFSWYAIH